MRVRYLVLVLMVMFLRVTLAQAQGSFTTLYNFTGGADGGAPWAGLTQDSSGNLYGTAILGGFIDGGYNYNCGVVYQVNTAGTETVLYDFCPYGEYASGTNPLAPVTPGNAGNFYGTATHGGLIGYGTVFNLDSAGNQTVLYSFIDQSDGCFPSQAPVIDKAGNIYGSTSDFECSYGYGAIFKIDNAGNFTVVHSFTRSDGAYPQYGRLTMDAGGNIYGVTEYGGAFNKGALYKLSKSGELTVLHSFKGGKDGCLPYGSVVRDGHGNLYGTTSYCGSKNDGTIWEVSEKGKETILHNFAGGTGDGCFPYGGVVRDSHDNLYGATYSCGAYGYYGTLYELNESGSLILLHSFNNSDGAYPTGEVLLTASGTLAGTTYKGGTDKFGTAWSYAP